MQKTHAATGSPKASHFPSYTDPRYVIRQLVRRPKKQLALTLWAKRRSSRPPAGLSSSTNECIPFRSQASAASPPATIPFKARRTRLKNTRKTWKNRVINHTRVGGTSNEARKRCAPCAEGGGGVRGLLCGALIRSMYDGKMRETRGW